MEYHLENPQQYKISNFLVQKAKPNPTQCIIFIFIQTLRHSGNSSSN